MPITKTEQSSPDGVLKLKGPNKYNVIMLNDDVTPMDFVIQILVMIFRKTADEAKDIMLEVHEKGRCVVGSYTFEIAEQKCVETVSEARKSGYPLDITIEEND